MANLNTISISAMLAIAPVLVSGSAYAQHRFDLTSENPAMMEPSATEGYGEGMGTKGMSGQQRLPLPLELTVVSFSPTSLMPGDKVTFEVSLRNVGSKAIDIPWSIGRDTWRISRADRQALYLLVTVPGNSHVLLGTMLFGTEFDRSMLTLEPNETANIRAEGRLRVEGPGAPTFTSSTVNVIARVWMSHGGVQTKEVISEEFQIHLRARPIPQPSSSRQSEP